MFESLLENDEYIRLMKVKEEYPLDCLTQREVGELRAIIAILKPYEVACMILSGMLKLLLKNVRCLVVFVYSFSFS